MKPRPRRVHWTVGELFVFAVACLELLVIGYAITTGLPLLWAWAQHLSW